MNFCHLIRHVSSCAARPLLVLALPVFVTAAEEPRQGPRTGEEILQMVRMSQALQELKHLNGVLRNDDTGKKIPFDLSMANQSIRFVFKDPTEIISLDLARNGADLRRVTAGSNVFIPQALYNEPVRETYINYEDLSMRFLYWPNAKLLGEETQHFRKCWHVRVVTPDGKGPYGTVDIWVDEGSGAMMKMEAYDRAGHKLKQFMVISGQKFKGAWILKEMRVEGYDPAKGTLKGRTYMDIKDPD